METARTRNLFLAVWALWAAGRVHGACRAGQALMPHVYPPSPPDDSRRHRRCKEPALYIFRNLHCISAPVPSWLRAGPLMAKSGSPRG
eukprot:350811-Chlamydomonas_euryale.AAC.3